MESSAFSFSLKEKMEKKVVAEKEWCTWDEWEIVTLISIYSSTDIQAQLELSKHNARVFEMIAERMKSYDIERTPQQCRNKIKKLKCEYRKVDLNPALKSTFNYYDQMSPLMKTAPTTKIVELDYSDPKSMLDIVNSFPPPPPLQNLKKCKEEPPSSNALSDDSRNYVEVELGEECSDSGAEDYREQWPTKPELSLGGRGGNGVGGGGTKRPLELDDEFEEDYEDPNGETSLDSYYSDSEQIVTVGQPSNGSVKRVRVSGNGGGGGHHQEQQQQQRQQQPVLETLMETFLESMRQERRSMRQEMAKFEERRIQLENEAELRKLQMEHQHELKMATLLGQITTQIIDSLAKKE